MKKIIAPFLLFTFANLPSAHEFWLQPDKFIYERGEPIHIRFHVGDNFAGENWQGDVSGIQSLQFYYDDIKDDLIPAMGDQTGDSIQVSVMDEGTTMVTFHGKNSFISQEASIFNASLQENGLHEIIEYRKEHSETDSSGREFVQNSVKTIFQVGSEFTNTFNQQTDLPLDIVLLENPYTFQDTQTLTVKIFFQQEPLKNKLIKIWHRVNGNTIKQEILSNDEGEISFLLATTGEWMISCVNTIRLTNDPGADWQSYLGSCTWGYYNE